MGNAVLAICLLVFGMSASFASLSLPTPDICSCRLEGYWDGEWLYLDCYVAAPGCAPDEYTEAFAPSLGFWICQCNGQADCACMTKTTYAGDDPEDNCYQSLPCNGVGSNECEKPTNPASGWHVLCDCR